MVGNRHAVAVEAVAPADVADLPLDGWNRVRLRLIDGSGRVYRRRVHRVGVRIGVIRGRERGAQEEPPDEGGTKAAAEAMEPMMETAMGAAMEAGLRPEMGQTRGLSTLHGFRPIASGS